MAQTYSIQDILTPLALTVIIDNKVRDPELSEFAVQAEGLLELLCEEQLSALQVIDWFRAHETDLHTRLNSLRKNTHVLTALNRFKDNNIAIESMYDAMLAISISDKEYHSDESDLIKSAASLWGYERPPFKIIR